MLWFRTKGLLLLALVLTGLGCEGEQATLPNGLPQVPQTEVFSPVGLGEPSNTIGLYRESSAVKVGDTWEKAKEVFPEPPRGAYELHDLPPKFPRDYEVHGWETGAGEGFGVILKNNKVLSAMYQLENTKQDTLNEFLSQQIQGAKVQPEIVVKGRERYWFWTDGPNHQTLMICALSASHGLNLTIAMGDDEILRHIGISEEEIKKSALAPPGQSSSMTRERFELSER